MNCAECQELLVAALEGLLETAQKKAVVDHLKTCPACRAQFKGLQALRQRLVSNGKALAVETQDFASPLEEQVMNRIIREQSARLKSADQAQKGLQLRRLLMKSSMVKIAVAAVIVLAVIGGIFLWTGTKSGVALADVLARMEQVQAFTYKATLHMKIAMPGSTPGESEMQMTWLIADDYGMRMDSRTPDPVTGQIVEQQSYLLPEQKVLLRLTPAKKQYERMKLDDLEFQKKQKESNDPRLLVRQMLGSSYQDVGKTVLDGVAVQGFQTTDPAFTAGVKEGEATLWVDVKTGLPVRMETKVRMNEQMEMQATEYDFQWDVPVSTAEFNPVIPADFTPGLADGTKAPMPTENGAIEGLRCSAEYYGTYLESLDPAELMKTLQKTFGNLKANPTPAMKKLVEEMAQAKTPEEGAMKSTMAMMPLQSLFMFHLNLVKEKRDPVYHGKVVQPGDAAQVLLRWKTADNEYRVIFGDLHTATVTADTLAKLEAALPK